MVSDSEAVIWRESQRGVMTKTVILERGLFAIFVVAANAFVVINFGWAFLMTSWNSTFASIVPIVSLMTLVSFLAFALLEDHLRIKRYGVEGFQP